MAVTVGVLALQGGFLEHLSLLHRSAQYLADAPALGASKHTFDFIEVRNQPDLSRCDGLIIPGGESTTIALIAAQSGLLEPLRHFVKSSRKPTWGTCAGLILLSEEANATKKGGQELIGGLDVRVHRNHFGRQIESFVADVALPFLAQSACLSEADAAAPFPGVFIRAPIVERLLVHCPGETRQQQGEGDKGTQEATVVKPGVLVGSSSSSSSSSSKDGTEKGKVEILGVLPDRKKKVAAGGPLEASWEEVPGGELNNIVAVRQGNIVGTSFHPELTDDVRMHIWWLEQVLKAVGTET